MDEIVILLVIMAVCFTLTGPVAFIIAIIALNKNRRTIDRIELLELRTSPKTESAKRPKPITKPKPVSPPLVAINNSEAVQVAEIVQKQKTETRVEAVQKAKPPVPPKHVLEKPKILMEQRIGTQWILIAGIIAVVVGVGFLLKLAYDNFEFPPAARVLAVAAAGFVALITGEITRRREYEIVAKGVTALGFILLYGAVFAAYQMHHLIEMGPAMALAIVITAGAMVYAAVLNEVLIAFLSLLGGFATPLIALDQFINPTALFAYATILSIGAMSVATFRKWRSINLITFVGTFALYSLWFFNNYHPNIGDATFTFETMPTAIGWLGFFSMMYLLMPIVYEIIQKTKSQAEDVLLIFFNAIVTFIYLWIILDNSPRGALPLAAVIIAIAHLVLAAVVTKRNKQDTNLRVVLTSIAIFFITIAIPLYFKLYFLTVAWIAEGLILAIIGLRYRSWRTQFSSIVPLLLSLIYMISKLPLHDQSFQLIFNPAFGLWVLLAAALLVYHIIFRLTGALEENIKKLISRLTFVFFGLVLFFAITAELLANCDINIQDGAAARRYFATGMVVLAIVEMFFFTVKPISPSGSLCRIITLTAGLIGTIFSLIALTLYRSSFMIFLNLNFAIAFALVLGLLGLAWLTKHYTKDFNPQTIAAQMPAAFVIWAVVLLLVLLTEQIWYFFDYSTSGIAGKAGIVAQMWISIAWAIYGTALMIVGFFAGSRPLRYIALGLFAILLGKVFFIDTQQMESIYRIIAFLATGVTMVGISYLYQFLKKKGFFDKLIAEKI